MDRPSVCLVGAGFISGKHARILKRLRPGAALAVVDVDRARADAFRAKHGLRDAFGNPREALESAYEIMVVGSPPATHAEWVREGIAAGKHLLIEKPVSQSLAEFTALRAPISAASSVVMVAENLHYAPFFLKLRRFLQTADLGRPLHLSLVRIGHNRPTGWRADASQMALGALHEGGVHWIRRLLQLASVFEADGTPGVREVSAFGPGGGPVTGTPGEDTTVVVARHASGLVSQLVHSWAGPRRLLPLDRSHLLTENGLLVFDTGGAWARFRGRTRRLFLPVIRDAAGYTSMWRDFLSAVESGTPPGLPMDTVFQDFAYLDAAYRSLATGTPQRPHGE